MGRGVQRVQFYNRDCIITGKKYGLCIEIGKYVLVMCRTVLPVHCVLVYCFMYSLSSLVVMYYCL